MVHAHRHPVKGTATGTITFGGTATGIGETPGPVTPTFPVIASSNNEFGTSLGTANPIPAPAAVAAGDLLIAFVSHDASTVITASTDWTQVIQQVVTTLHRLAVFARVADGGANDILAISGTTQDYCATIHRITSHAVTAIADIKSAVTTGTGTVIDAPSLDAGATRKWLWLVSAGIACDNAGDDFTPLTLANYTIFYNFKSAANTTASALLVARRELETQTENPAAFSAFGAPRSFVTVTVAVPGAGS